MREDTKDLRSASDMSGEGTPLDAALQHSLARQRTSVAAAMWQIGKHTRDEQENLSFGIRAIHRVGK